MGRERVVGRRREMEVVEMGRRWRERGWSDRNRNEGGLGRG